MFRNGGLAQTGVFVDDERSRQYIDRLSFVILGVYLHVILGNNKGTDDRTLIFALSG